MDGNLTPQQMLEVDKFLSENIDIKTEFEGLGNLALIPVEQVYTTKDKLLKKDTAFKADDDEFYRLCVASVEETITETEQHMLDGMLESNQERAEEYKLFMLTKLKPQLHIQYAKKSQLKRYSLLGISPRMAKGLSAAAAVAVLLLLFSNLFNFQGSVVSPEISSNENPLAQENANKPSDTKEDRKEDLLAKEFIPETNTLSKDVVAAIVPTLHQVSEEENVLKENQVVEEEVFEDAPTSIERMSSISLATISFGAEDVRIAAPLVLPSNVLPSTEQAVRQTKVIDVSDLVLLAFNRLFQKEENEYGIEAERNDKGELQRIHIETSLFALSTPVRRK